MFRPVVNFFNGYCIADTHHATEGVAKEDGMTVEQGPVSTPLTRLPGNTQVTYYHIVIQHP